MLRKREAAPVLDLWLSNGQDLQRTFKIDLEAFFRQYRGQEDERAHFRKKEEFNARPFVI